MRRNDVLHWAHAIRFVVVAAVALVVISSSALAAAASRLAAPGPQTQPGQQSLAADRDRNAAATTTQNRLAHDERRQDAAAAQAEVKVQAEVRQRAAAQEHQAAQQQAAQQQAQQAQPNGARAAPAGSVPQIIQQAFAPLGAGAVRWALTIARRESNFDPRAENPSGASGLFQFMPSTFAKSPPGQAGKSIWDPVANAEAAAWMYAQGRQNEWSTNY
jgi:soluble lytic murein transglycosylase-like protein